MKPESTVMSTETTGHTPGPWTVRLHNDGHSIWHESGGLRSLILTLNGFNLCDEHGGSSAANAQRIVDCVNALSPVADPVEYMNNVAPIVAKYGKLTAHDELMAAENRALRAECERLKEAFGEWLYQSDRAPTSEGVYMAQDRAKAKARAALVSK